MHIAKKYGRNDDYNFNINRKLNCIKTGKYSDQKNYDKTKNIFAINSFSTIWLLTQPENFQDWIENRNSLSNAAPEGGTFVFLLGSLHFHIMQNPTFTFLLPVIQIKIF